jgi:hypothetical protein
MSAEEDLARLEGELREARNINATMVQRIGELQGWMQTVDATISGAEHRHSRSTRQHSQRLAPLSHRHSVNAVSHRSMGSARASVPPTPHAVAGSGSHRWGRRSAMNTPHDTYQLDLEEKQKLKTNIGDRASPKTQPPWPAPGVPGPGMRGAGENGYFRPMGQTTISFNFASGKPSAFR